jgi:hypothetical protein
MMTSTLSDPTSRLDQGREEIWHQFMSGSLTPNAATVRLLALDLAVRQGDTFALDALGEAAGSDGQPATARAV